MDGPETQLSTTSEQSLKFFDATPWCRQYLYTSGFAILDLPRTSTANNGRTLWGTTYNTPQTIPQLLTLYRPPCTRTGTRGEMRRFLQLGSGMNEHPDVFHGGAIATVLDSAVGNLIRHERPDLTPAFTAYLNVSYKKAIITPTVILSRSWITKVEGRKIWVSAEIWDGVGRVLATGDALFVQRMANI